MPTTPENTIPGARLKNPLGNFASYTYQLSLYMITPDAYSAYVNGGRVDVKQYLTSDVNGANVSGGAYLILQSGGVNTDTDQRPPGMKYDYYIDNLVIKSATNTKSTMTESNITSMTFNIIEPYGFSLISRLKEAHEKLKNVCKIKNYNKTRDPLRQFFILSIRFQGYDKDGRVAKASEYFSDDTYNNSPDSSGVYERFYDIAIEKFTFKLGGGATTYNVNAKVIPNFIGMQTLRGSITNNISVVANSVENALGPGVTGPNLVSLFDSINENMKKQEGKDRETADVYKIRWVGESDLLKKSLLKSPANTEKSRSAPANVNDTAQVNEATAQKATYDSSKKTIDIPAGSSILQAINKIIRNSQYLESALNTVYKSTYEVYANDSAPQQTATQANPAKLEWFNVSTEIKVLAFDSKLNDYAYEITYVIQPYETPAAFTPYGKQVSYYGPHKRYDYWFTGKNSEIINFEMQFDNAFFNINFGGDQSGVTSSAQIPQASNRKSGMDPTGGQFPNQEAQNTYMTSLFDPKAYAEPKVTILGDPDFLMRDTPNSVNEVYRQFYGNNFTINPNGGQVFIEINFNEGVDYNLSEGTMTINESIEFWRYPSTVKKIQGISFMVTEVESIFKGGKFTQNLKLILNQMADAEAAPSAQESFRRSERAEQSNGTPTGTPGTTTSGTGLTPDALPGGTNDVPVDPPTPNNNNNPDDDAGE